MKNYLILFLVSSFLWAQDATILKQFYLEPNRKCFAVSKEDANEKVLFLKDRLSIEYSLTDKNLVAEFQLVHRIVRYNSHEAIESFNKIYIPMDEVADILKLEARVITPSGKIINFDKKNLKDLNEESDKGKVKMFAVEGAEINAELEYFYLTRRKTDFMGSQIFQFPFPVKETLFELISPMSLIYEAKSYNKLNPVKTDTIEGKRRLMVSHKNIPSFQSEAFAYQRPNKMRVDYKLSMETSMPNTRLFSWETVSSKIAPVFNFNTNEDKFAVKMIKEIKIDPKSQDETKIRAIEEYIKNNIGLVQQNVNTNIDQIYVSKFTGAIGFTRLFVALLEKAGIEYKLVLTSKRDEGKIDPDLEIWNYLSTYIIYFPKHDLYLCPSEQETRYGIIPSNLTNTHGLFLTPKRGKNKEMSFFSEIAFIKPLTHLLSSHNTYVKVEVVDKDKMPTQITHVFTGYTAENLVPYYEHMKEDDKENLAKNVNEVEKMGYQLKDFSFTNQKYTSETPMGKFEMVSNLDASSLIETAGKWMFVKVGELIGTQSELYQEKKRMLPIENDYNRNYTRKITVNVPDNYKIKNPENFNLRVEHKAEGKTTMCFVSKSFVNGNELVVDVDEYYAKIDYTIEEYETFRKVINAAADFNKRVLVLEKK